jgi:ribosomal protein L21
MTALPAALEENQRTDVMPRTLSSSSSAAATMAAATAAAASSSSSSRPQASKYAIALFGSTRQLLEEGAVYSAERSTLPAAAAGATVELRTVLALRDGLAFVWAGAGGERYLRDVVVRATVLEEYASPPPPCGVAAAAGRPPAVMCRFRVGSIEQA